MARSVDYDHIAKTYDRRYQENDYSGVEAALIAFIGEDFNQRVLEVSGGHGPWLRLFGGRGVRVTGLDASAQMPVRSGTCRPARRRGGIGARTPR